MKAIVTRDIDIKNEEVAEKCYAEFTDSINIAIQDFLMDEYNIDCDTADKIVYNLPKNDFIEIITSYLEKVKNDKFF